MRKQLALYEVRLHVKKVGKRWHAFATLTFPKLGRRAFSQTILLGRYRTKLEADKQLCPF